MKTVKSVLIILAVIFVSCKEKTNPVSSDVDFSYFTTSWTNSYEEETINHETEIFRPSNYKEANQQQKIHTIRQLSYYLTFQLLLKWQIWG